MYNHASKSYAINSCRCRTHFDVVSKRARVREIDALSSAEDFWNDQTTAATLMQEREQLQQCIDIVSTCTADLADIEELLLLTSEQAELDTLAKNVDELAQRITLLQKETLFAGPYDDANVIITIRAGAGGDDAQDWSDMLAKMYIRWSEKKDAHVTILERTDGSIAGIKSMSLKLTMRHAYGHLKSEAGVHRLVRLSPFNADNLRQTSFAQVEILPVIAALPAVEIRSDDLKIDTFRSSGAGGQSVNTTDSAVRVTHLPTNTVVSCQNERSQLQNKEHAIMILTAKLHQQYLVQEEARQKNLRGQQKQPEWGSQIRSYVLHPYKLVKDHRTKYETAQIDDVLSGDLDGFMESYLLLAAANNNVI